MDGGDEILKPFHKFKFDLKTALHVFEREFIQQRLFHTNSFFHRLVPTHGFLPLNSGGCCLLLTADFLPSWRLVTRGVCGAFCGVKNGTVCVIHAPAGFITFRQRASTSMTSTSLSDPFGGASGLRCRSCLVVLRCGNRQQPVSKRIL